jgi:hypothetical protein
MTTPTSQTQPKKRPNDGDRRPFFLVASGQR